LLALHVVVVDLEVSVIADFRQTNIVGVAGWKETALPGFLVRDEKALRRRVERDVVPWLLVKLAALQSSFCV
jgi:hypothetical protein